MASKKTSGQLMVELIALADNAFLSKDNKLNVIGIFDIFGIAKVPTRWSKMNLVVVFKGPPGTVHSVKVKIQSPDKLLLEKDFPVKLGQNGKSNFITTLNNFPLETFGEYQIVASINDREIGDYKFSVIKRKEAPTKKAKGFVN